MFVVVGHSMANRSKKETLYKTNPSPPLVYHCGSGIMEFATANEEQEVVAEGRQGNRVESEMRGIVFSKGERGSIQKRRITNATK